jgi:hypothetical protein
MEILLNGSIPLPVRSSIAEFNWFYPVVKDWGFTNFADEYLEDACYYHPATLLNYLQVAKNPNLVWGNVSDFIGQDGLNYSLKDQFILALTHSVLTEEFIDSLVKNTLELDLDVSVVLSKIREALNITNDIPDVWVWKMFGASMEVAS